MQEADVMEHTRRCSTTSAYSSTSPRQMGVAVRLVFRLRLPIHYGRPFSPGKQVCPSIRLGATHIMAAGATDGISV